MPKSHIANKGDYKRRLTIARGLVLGLKTRIVELEQTLVVADELAVHHQDLHATCDWHPGMPATPQVEVAP